MIHTYVSSFSVACCWSWVGVGSTHSMCQVDNYCLLETAAAQVLKPPALFAMICCINESPFLCPATMCGLLLGHLLQLLAGCLHVRSGQRGQLHLSTNIRTE
jgi:hypothetical protein